MTFANPFNHADMPDEPPRGAVIAYQLSFTPPRSTGFSTALYDYVSFRAGDGRWYTTGKRGNVSGETWDDLFNRIQRKLVGPIKYVTAWDLLHEAYQPPLATARPIEADDDEDFLE